MEGEKGFCAHSEFLSTSKNEISSLLLAELIQERTSGDQRKRILSYAPVKASRLYVDLEKRNEFSFKDRRVTLDDVQYFYSYEKEDYVDERTYIRLFFGYFSDDPNRKYFLVFPFLVYRSNVHLEYIPQKEVQQLYLLNASLPDSSDLTKIPLDIRSFCLSDLKVEVSLIIDIIKRLSNMTKFAIQNIEGLNNVELMNLLAGKCTIVRIMDCDLIDDCAKILIDPKSIVRSINLESNKQLTNDAFSSIGENKNLVIVRLNHTNIDDIIIPQFLKNPNLHELQISETQISSAGIFGLIYSEINNIRILEWMSNDWFVEGNTEKSIRNIINNKYSLALKKNRNLEVLRLDCTTGDTLTLCQFVSVVCCNLVEISLNDCKLEDEDVTLFLESQMNLRSIHLSGNEKLTRKTIKKLSYGDHPRLSEIEYRQKSMTNEDVEFFFRSPRIKELWIAGNFSDLAFEAMKDNLTLEVLNLVGQGVVSGDVVQNQAEWARKTLVTVNGIRFLKEKTTIRCIVTGSETSEKTWVRNGVKYNMCRRRRK